MIGAGLLAKKAVERGLTTKPWVKTSLAPGSRVVTDYLDGSGLMPYLEQLRFNTVGYGCTTCIGNSGPLPEPVAQLIDEHCLVTAAVLSGNRNFEARVHPQVRANYLASPMLVVAFALAGRVDIDLTREPLGNGKDGRPVYPQGHLADGRGSSRHDDRLAQALDVREALRLGVRGRRGVAGLSCPRAAGTPGTPRARTSPSRRSSRTSAPSRGRSRTSTEHASSPCSATRSPPTTSRRRDRSRRTDRPRGTCSITASRSTTGTPSVPAADTTK